MTAEDRAARQRAADAASKPSRLVDLGALLAEVPVRNDGRGVDALIPTRLEDPRLDYGVEAQFSDGSVWRRQSVGTRADAQEHLNLCQRREGLGLTTSSRDPFTRLSFVLIVRTSIWSNDWRIAEGADVILYCDHGWSLSGAEGPVVDLGRWPILWTCDSCGATVLDDEKEWTRR